MISTTSALPGSRVALSERGSDFHDVGFAGVKGRAVGTSAPMISTTYAFQGLEVKGQGSILASPALYKDEQNGAPGSLEGSESRVEPEVWCQGWWTEPESIRVETVELRA